MAGVLSTDRVALLLDAGGDLDISAGALRFATGLTAFAQGADARLKLIRGELFVNRAAGLPLIENDYVTPAQALSGQAYNEGKARLAVTAAISTTPGFGALTSLAFAFDRVARRLSVTWAARTAFGDATSTVEI